MMITVTEIHDIMYDFYLHHQRLPNTILMPASEQVIGYDPVQIARVLCVKIVFAAVSEPRAAIL